MQHATPPSSSEQEFKSDIAPEAPATSFIIHHSPRNLNLLWCPQGQLVDV